ncbi:MAG TPA: cytochrome P450, partial [Ktedonobacteraceae bacterium]|nr:cytochrome P450 [Ktedonobacteraceae bacterium]
QCPVDHTVWSRQKTALVSDPTASTDESAGVPIARDSSGIWHVRGFQEARAILRHDSTRQAGFGAPQIEQLSGFLKPSILFQEGPTHHQQRKQTARFFTPKAVNSNYRPLMEQLSDEIIADLQHRKKGNLSEISFKLAVGVAAQIIGLTHSRNSHMEKRLNAFFTSSFPTNLPAWHPLNLVIFFLIVQTQLRFYLNDVRPAIRAHKQQTQDDLISHMLSQKARQRDIHIECVTYAAAGMVTTREFIMMAAWHFLEHPDLRARYLAATEPERYLLLEEILRLEPVIGHLYRRATADITIESQGQTFTIKKGELLHLHTYAINTDPKVVTEHQRALCPGRTLQAEHAPASLMGFGDGDHRCAGLYVALQESDIFLCRLLALENLRLEHPPTVRWNGATTGYEVHHFIVTLA